jgi:biopolymer transport protein ExbD
MTGPGGVPDSHGPGSQPADIVGARVQHEGRKLATGGGVSRAKMARESRRAAQFAKFRMTELNLIPLVDTFVSIVFFALTTAAVGELAPVVKGVTLPESTVGNNALKELTIGVASDNVTLSGQPVMRTVAAAQAQSNNPQQPLLIPELYAALRIKADSVRQATNTPGDQSVNTKLAIQGDKAMRYDLLSRVLQTARLAGFKNVTLQVNRTGADEGPSTPVQTQASLD